MMCATKFRVCGAQNQGIHATYLASVCALIKGPLMRQNSCVTILDVYKI